MVGIRRRSSRVAVERSGVPRYDTGAVEEFARGFPASKNGTLTRIVLAQSAASGAPMRWNVERKRT